MNRTLMLSLAAGSAISTANPSLITPGHVERIRSEVDSVPNRIVEDSEPDNASITVTVNADIGPQTAELVSRDPKAIVVNLNDETYTFSLRKDGEYVLVGKRIGSNFTVKL